jgi:two-component system, OmpR family, osmolarity sensor histidine kinase EnvZ
LIGRLRVPLGLLGRILAILLLTVVIEFGASTLLYERASRFSVREDEANRLAEHLVIARKLMAERPWGERPRIAQELTTDRYEIRWSPLLRAPPVLAIEVQDMRSQIIQWEPTLAQSDIRLTLLSPGRKSTVNGVLRLPDGTWLYFMMREPVQGWDLALNRIVLALVPAIALLVIGALLIRRTLRPIRRLAEATERIGHGEEVLVQEAGTFEIRRLTREFNAMQIRIHRLVEDRTQALAAVGHDLRTPLARLQLRLDSVNDEDLRRQIGDDLGEMNALLTSLLAFLGGEDDPEPKVSTDIAVLAATLVDDATDRGLDASYEGPDHLEALARPLGLRRALGNLLENALHYGKKAQVQLESSSAQIRIRIEDDGPGIPHEQLERVLQPFTRLDSARRRNTKGLGLGLAIAVQAIRDQGGTLRLYNRQQGGLCAEIILPR